jgi:3-deoxy-D-manno-octulosonate 8-phosphate phosphatase (KDO 8-P phosphatase)
MQADQSSSSPLQSIRALAMDVDGVLTDGGFWWGADGAEWKRFSFLDIMGLSLARRAGIQLALISGENSPLVDRYAQKMSINFVAKGCRDKAAALRDFAQSASLPLAHIAFMGDDVNDLPAMRIAGLAAAPATAAPDVLAYAAFVSTRPGGNGAVREFVEALLNARGLTAAEIYTKA